MDKVDETKKLLMDYYGTPNINKLKRVEEMIQNKIKLCNQEDARKRNEFQSRICKRVEEIAGDFAKDIQMLDEHIMGARLDKITVFSCVYTQ